MSISISRSSVKTFYICNNCSRANAIAFIVVLFVKFIPFFIRFICAYVCLFVRMDGLLLQVV
jgi:hypothetical protein